VNELRSRQQRVLLTTLLLSFGVPLILGGDEFGRTQGGNNNAYCQDNEMSWLDWTLAATPQGEAMTAFVARAIALRREHPLLRQAHFLFGDRDVLPGVHDVDWFDEHGEPLSPEAWQDPEARAFAVRRAGPGLDGEIEVLLMMLNASAHAVTFTAAAPHFAWSVLLDSAHPEDAPHALPDVSLEVAAHALVVLGARPARHGGPAAAQGTGTPARDQESSAAQGGEAPPPDPRQPGAALAPTDPGANDER
jgi:glycogen operon protein